jgi:hypothetical protein
MGNLTHSNTVATGWRRTLVPSCWPRVESTLPPRKFLIEIRIRYVPFVRGRGFWSPSVFNLVSGIYIVADNRATFRPWLSAFSSPIASYPLSLCNGLKQISLLIHNFDPRHFQTLNTPMHVVQFMLPFSLN